MQKFIVKGFAITSLVAGAFWGSNLANAYDNPLGTTVLNGVSTPDTIVTNEGTLGSLANPTPPAPAQAHSGIGLKTTGVAASITNSGTINGYGGFGVLEIDGANSTVINASSGIINSIGYGNAVQLNSTNISFTNNGLITDTANSGSWGIYFNNGAPVTAAIINNGSITVSGEDASAIFIDVHDTATSILNSSTGLIQTSSNASGGGIVLGNGGADIHADLITNVGSIVATGGGFGINNGYGVVGTLNNLQGVGNTYGGLTYGGKLPTNYNIIINSLAAYGQLNVSNASGQTTFGIYGGGISGVPASVVNANGKYTGVLSGLVASNLVNTNIAYSGLTGTLTLQSGSTNIWDLCFGLCNVTSGSSGPSPVDTQAALSKSASRLRAAYNKASESSNFPTSNTYDCNLFDVKGMCVSAGGRYTSAENPHSHSTAAVLVLGYKVSDNLRIGGFLDQSTNNSAPAGIQISNKNPMLGAFLYWNQNADGLGYQVKLANTYQDKDITLTRDVIGTSESGTGKTGLTTESYVGELSYAFAYQDKTILRPYLGLRYTSIEQDGYTETGVTTPLTYSALKDETTSALVGVKFKHQLTEKATLTGSLGIEQDLHHKAGNFTATGLSGLTAENFSGDLHRTRGLASLGAYYAVAKSQRISGEVMLQELPFQNSLGATAYVNYMIGF